MPYESLLQGRVSTPGQCYCVTTATADRYPLFTEIAAARTAINVIRVLDKARHSQTLALVVMPDHVHWLFRLGLFLSLSEVVRRFKGRSAHALRAASEPSKVWQCGFHERALRSDESLTDAASYILQNPVRAGIVSHIGDYPFWHSAWSIDDEWSVAR
ncbi:MAG: REP-associated tyrosine transposase [Povalibacter sp.]